MQDRLPQLVEIFLLRTAGPYIGVNRVGSGLGRILPCQLRSESGRDESAVARDDLSIRSI